MKIFDKLEAFQKFIDNLLETFYFGYKPGGERPRAGPLHI
jgi:hypothetical protein